MPLNIQDVDVGYQFPVVAHSIFFTAKGLTLMYFKEIQVRAG